MTFTPPSLAEMVAKYQAFLAPEDPKFGEGISGWDITSEYDTDPKSESDGSPIWGCMCSPSILASEGKRVKLQPEDVAAKRAHIVVRTPTNRSDLLEIERTVMHELGHVLHAKLNLPRDAEEEIMHSLDHFFSKLSPEQGAILARSFQNPMARAYRAETTAMPDPTEEKKEPDKEAPKMAEGAPRDIATIEAEMLKTRLAGGDIAALQDEWFAAKMAATAAALPPAPIEPQTMGMKPEEAYARGQKAAEVAGEKKLVDRFANTLKDLNNEQLAMVRRMPSLDDAEALVKTYPRQSGGQTMGVLPGKTPGKTTDETPFARMRKLPEDPMVREALGLGGAVPGSHGVSVAPAHVLVFSMHDQAQSHKAANRAMAQKKEAAQ